MTIFSPGFVSILLPPPSAVWPSPRWSLGAIPGNGGAELKPDDGDDADEV